MEYCMHCQRDVTMDSFDGGLSCKICGRVLENFYYIEEVVFMKAEAGQKSQAAGDIEKSVQGEITTSITQEIKELSLVSESGGEQKSPNF